MYTYISLIYITFVNCHLLEGHLSY